MALKVVLVNEEAWPMRELQERTLSLLRRWAAQGAIHEDAVTSLSRQTGARC